MLRKKKKCKLSNLLVFELESYYLSLNLECANSSIARISIHVRLFKLCGIE